MALCSFMGLPWYVAATVISIAHIDSLKMETETSAPGEQPQFLGVRYEGSGSRSPEWERGSLLFIPAKNVGRKGPYCDIPGTTGPGHHNWK